MLRDDIVSILISVSRSNPVTWEKSFFFFLLVGNGLSWHKSPTFESKYEWEWFKNKLWEFKFIYFADLLCQLRNNWLLFFFFSFQTYQISSFSLRFTFFVKTAFLVLLFPSGIFVYISWCVVPAASSFIHILGISVA